MVCPVRERSDWIWQSRWRQVYFVVGTIATGALLGLLIEGRVAIELVALAAVGALGGLVLADRRRQQ